MMTAEQLKGSILQLAMQGKLVEQRPEEGTGEELYKEIQEEKKRLIKKGRIKKDKKFTDVIEMDYPFDIPESWKWVKFGSVMNVVSARRVHQADWKDHGVPFYRAREIAKLAETGFVENELFISEELYEEFSKSGVPEPGDLMVTGVGTLGKTYVVKEGDRFYYKDASVLCFENYANLEPVFIKQIMESPSMKGQIKGNSSGTTVATLTMVRMVEYLIPLPPLAEQKRIVAKIEELMPFVEQYAVASTKLNTLNTTFPEMMKKSILQEAVQGKLVPQDPNDEPASKLLKKIAEEKKRLIKEGKIKKQKPLPEITEDEIPFDIPESWEWVRLGTILTLLTDGTHKTPHYVEEGIPFISVKDMSSGKISFSNTKFITEKEADEINMRCNPQRGDILLSKVGTTGVPAPVDTDIKFSLFVSVALLKFNNDFINREYLINVICSPCVQKQCAENTRGVGNKNWVMRDIANTLIPIAPLREQESIVSELKRIIPSFASLEQKIH